MFNTFVNIEKKQMLLKSYLSNRIAYSKKVFVILFFSTYSLVFSQIKIFFAADPSSKSQITFVKNNKINFLEVFYANVFITNDQLDVNKLKETINKRFPDKNANAFLMLDWEGKTYDNLFKKETYKPALAKFISAIDIIKKSRPNIKVGYYGFPSREFWNADNTWKSKNHLLGPLYKKMDFIANSIYMFYEDSQIKSSLNTKYIEDNVALALSIGKKYNKPVYPVIWHRYHPSNKQYGLMKIPFSTFRNYISTIIDTSVDGKKISGIFWWQADVYYRNTEKSNQNLIKEYQGIKNFDDYDTTLFKKYLEIIQEVSKQ